jgi:DNA (cytosine-5)-methyltransferase 1
MMAVSLFSNCGAGDVGFRRAGFDFQVMAELDSRRLEVAGLNHPGAMLIPGDLRVTWPSVVSAYKQRSPGRRLDLLSACPPCQGMSSARATRGTENDPDAGSRDPRNLLVLPIARVTRALTPRAIVVENVPAFFSRLVRHPDDDRPISAAALLVEMLDRDYVAFPIITDLSDYGVPQLRRRAFLTFIRRSEPALARLASRLPYPRPTHLSPARRSRLALSAVLKDSGLESLDAGSPARAGIRNGRSLHVVPVWPPRRYQMVAAIPPGSGASAWDTSRCAGCSKTCENERRATCRNCGDALLRPVVRARNGRWRLVRGFKTSYRRMRMDVPASTITTASGHVGSDCTIHPFENRVLSPQECAMIQTIPRSFSWGRALSKWGHTFVREMIGEAVPPRFTQRHGRALTAILSNRAGAVALLAAGDVRERSGRARLAAEGCLADED